MTKSKFNLEDFKQSLNMTELEEKKPKYVILNDELQANLGLPGFPLGDITEIYGDSDTGKSTLMLHAAAQAQKQGIFPVLIIVEKKYRRERAEALGLNPDEALVNLSCRTIEDIFEFTDLILAKVNKGKLPQDTMIFIDSLGNVNSREARKERQDGTTELKNIHQKNAKIITENLMLMSDKIGDTRFTTHNHYVGIVILNQIYTAPPAFPGGMSRTVPRGGKKLKYVSSLQIETKKTKELSAIVDGNSKAFGIISKIVVKKNHINSVKNTGEFVITADKIFANHPGAIEDYKKLNREKWGEYEIVQYEAEDSQ
jgi:recombination protein RecA